MAPVCSNCRADAVGFVIPSSIAEQSRVTTPYASLCRVCLTVDPLEDEPDSTDSLSLISDAFPEDDETAAMIAIVVDLLDSLALNRRAIQEVIDQLEADGVDPLLILERLVEDTSLSPAIDLDRRTYQLNQLLE